MNLQAALNERAAGLPRCEAAIACFLAFIGTVLLMPFVKDGYGIAQTISEGAIGAMGWVQGTGILALAAGSAIVASAVGRAGARVPAALIGTSAICTAMLVAFPTDAGDSARTVAGRVHYVLAAGAFLTSIGAMFAAKRAFRCDELRCLAAPSLVIGGAALIFLVGLAAGAEPRGVIQRAAAACIVAWMIALAVRLRGESAADDATEADV
jgi:hypothetical protein